MNIDEVEHAGSLEKVAAFALRLIGSFTALAFTAEYALAKIAYLGECQSELDLQVDRRNLAN